MPTANAQATQNTRHMAAIATSAPPMRATATSNVTRFSSFGGGGPNLILRERPLAGRYSEVGVPRPAAAWTSASAVPSAPPPPQEEALPVRTGRPTTLRPSPQCRSIDSISPGATTVTGISEEICARAWQTIEPAISKAAELGLSNAFRGSLIVLDPATPDPKAPLFAAHVGEFDQEFLSNVEGKVAVTTRTGLDSSRVRQDFPYLYRQGESSTQERSSARA